MDETLRKIVEIFYSDKPSTSTLLLLSLEASKDEQGELLVNSLSTGDYDDLVVLLANAISNVALSNKISVQNVVLHLCKQLEDKSTRETILSVKINEKGETIEEKPEQLTGAQTAKAKKFQIISLDDNDDADE